MFNNLSKLHSSYYSGSSRANPYDGILHYRFNSDTIALWFAF